MKEQRMMDVTIGLTNFASSAAPTEAALGMMRLSLFDWAACAIAGADEPVARILRDKALDEAGTGQASLIGGGRASCSVAALVNGATSHALDYDDTHFAHIGHPSVAVIPAALALAQRDGAGMQALLEAALIGAEGSIRFGIWLGRPHYQIGFHQTATAGAIGATLAAIRLLDQPAAVAHHALGLAATRASGLKSQFGTMGKPYNAGLAAETGVEAALLAGLGMTSAVDGLSGAQGFGPTHHGSADASAFDGLGADWKFQSISHKFHACCHGLHAMLEALSEIETAPDEITSVAVATHPRWLSVCNIAEPTTGLEAKFSYRLTAAMALSGIETGAIESFSDITATDPQLAALRDRVSVAGDDRLSETEARVTLTLANGDTVATAHDLDAPITVPDRSAKLRRKAASLLGKARAERLWQAVRAETLGPLVQELAGQETWS
ncbi:MAG: MmgE/PrpD family protein [Paracoccaceae bacterium]